ncbi:hypothetical protein [Dactylosporangium aurantiacum]|uniref:hypothetical protein n=1 Tax=Dactylosporangium aurantiacum TaxID=35754 RepID=UPI001FDEE756|nr:hypothetical protein [Dactylosporangium aurantiacum]MDG6101914.1 hypothetical protein [Dactylosporangium aurantiacum]
MSLVFFLVVFLVVFLVFFELVVGRFLNRRGGSGRDGRDRLGDGRDWLGLNGRGRHALGRFGRRARDQRHEHGESRGPRGNRHGNRPRLPLGGAGPGDRLRPSIAAGHDQQIRYGHGRLGGWIDFVRYGVGHWVAPRVGGQLPDRARAHRPSPSHR